MILVPATGARELMAESLYGVPVEQRPPWSTRESSYGRQTGRAALAVLKRVRVLAAWALFTSLSLAAPDQDDPAGALSVRSEAINQQIQIAALKQYQDAASKIQKFQESLDQGHLERVKPAQITEAYGAALRLEEFGYQLLDLGEPAGVDFGQRAERHIQQLDSLIAKYRLLPGMADKIDSSTGVLSQERKKRMPAVSKAEKLTAAGKHLESAEVIFEATYRIRSMAAWLIGDDLKFALGGLSIPLRSAFAVSRKQRSAQTKELLQASRNNLTPDFASLLSDMEIASDSLRATGQVQREGKPIAGPQLVHEFSQRWQQMHHAAVQCRALDWAQGSATDQSEQLDQMLTQQKKCAEQFFPAITGLIAADSLHISSSEVEPRYTAYLQELAPLVSLRADRTIPDDLSQALETLASKSAPFAGGARSYRLAMSELLRWRSRQAESLAKSRGAKKSSLDQALLTAVRADAEGPGLVPVNAQDTSKLAIGKSVPDAMKVAVKRLLNQEVTVSSLAGFPDRGNLVVSRYHARNYAWFRRVEGWDAAVAALQKDLLVHQAAPPLSLEAAVALSSAERGDAVAAGGAVVGLALEPLATRMATLSEQDRALIPLGPLPAEPVGSDPLSHVLMRIKLAPTWVRHEYFFVPAE